MSGGDQVGRTGQGGDRFAGEWDRCESLYLARLREAGHVAGNWRDRLRAAVWASARLACSDPAAARLLAVEALAQGRLGQERQRALGQRLVAMLEDWRRQSGEAPGEMSSRWALSVLFAGFHRCIAAGEPEALAAEVPQLMFLAVSPFSGVSDALAELEWPPPR